MNLTMMKAKIHRAKVTEADLNYEGSISLCPKLIASSGLLTNERVDVYNCNNGQRFSTYVIEGLRGQVCLNGAAARLVAVGDLVIIVAYASMDKEEALKHRPKVVFVDEKNQEVEKRFESAENNVPKGNHQHQMSSL